MPDVWNESVCEMIEIKGGRGGERESESKIVDTSSSFSVLITHHPRPGEAV